MANINGYGSTGFVKSSSYVNNIVSNSLNTSKEESSFGSISNNSFAQVAISTFGSKINEVYNTLKTIENPEDRQSAMEGMRSMMTKLFGEPSRSELTNFVSTVGTATDATAEDFQAVFGVGNDSAGDEVPEPAGFGETAPSTSSTTASTVTPTTFADTYGSVSSSDMGDEFQDAGLDMIMSDGTSQEKKSAFDDLLGKANEILTAELTETERNSVAERFFVGLSDQSTLSDKVAYIQNFSVSVEGGSGDTPESTEDPDE